MKPVYEYHLKFSNAWTALFTLGGVILIMCIIGLIAACHAIRKMLIIYEVALFLAFITHIVLIIVLIDWTKEELTIENTRYELKHILREILKFPSLYIIPNVVALCLELFFIVAIPFLIRHLSKNNRTTAYSEIKMSDLSQHNTYPSL